MPEVLTDAEVATIHDRLDGAERAVDRQAEAVDRLEAALTRLVSSREKSAASLERLIGMVEHLDGLLPQSRSRPALRLVVAQVETDGMARTTARTRRSRRKPPAKS